MFRQQPHSHATGQGRTGVDNSLYEALGVSRNADEREIKTAFRKLAAIYHPDKPTGNKEKFQAINHAHEILSNPETRRIYNLGGLSGVQQQQQRKAANAAGQGAANEMLRRMFGGAFAGGPGMSRGSDDDDGDAFSTAGPGGPRVFTFQFGGAPSAQGFGAESFFASGFPFPHGVPGMGASAARNAFGKEPDIQHLCDVTMEQVFAQQPHVFDLQVRKRKQGTSAPSSSSSSSSSSATSSSSTSSAAPPVTLVEETCRFKVTFKSWNDLQTPILLRRKGNQHASEQIHDGDICVRTNLISHQQFTPCNTHDLVMCQTISFEDSVCGFEFPVRFIDAQNTTIHLTNRRVTHQLVQSGTVFKCPLGLALRDLDSSFVFNAETANYAAFGTLFVVIDVQTPDVLSDEQRQRLAERLRSEGNSSSSDHKKGGETEKIVVHLERASPRIEMQLARDLLLKKLEARAQERMK